MKDIATLKDLMIFHLHQLHDAELQWSYALRETADMISSAELRKYFREGSEHCFHHAFELEKILKKVEAGSIERKNPVAADMVRELKETEGNSADPEVRDAAMIVTHQCMNHYMIAKYGSLSSFARLLGEEDIARTLHTIMEEEKTEDELLTKVAEEKINVKAKAPLVL